MSGTSSARSTTIGGGSTLAVRVSLVIPFRDRGIDPLRQQNLVCVIKHWRGLGYQPLIVSDGRHGDEQFNRSAAYNRAVRESNADVFIFTESDMLVPYRQVMEATAMAYREPGLVIPFTEYLYVGAARSAAIRAGVSPEHADAEWIMNYGTSVGAVNIVSRETLELTGGYDENFEGSWYDDNAMAHAFRFLAGQTRWVKGVAFHLYHLPGWKGDHLTEEDRAATARNKERFERYKAAETNEQVRALIMEGRS